MPEMMICPKRCPLCGGGHNKRHDKRLSCRYVTECPACIPYVEPVQAFSLSEEPLLKPKIVCLCGSTRFTREMLIRQWELTKQGYIVLSWCALPDDYYKGNEKAHIGDQEGVKVLCDELHKRKIDLSDEVLILNIGGYIGESTRSELEYAKAHNKTIRFLEAPHV